MRVRVKTLRSALLCAALLAASGPTQAASQQEASSLFDAESTLRSRHRETLHPGAPLHIVGLEQGDNDFRASTPALARSDRAATQVDLDELYRRRLAAYTEGRTFRAPLPRSASAPSLQHETVEAGRDGSPAASEAPSAEPLTARLLGPAALIFMLLAVGTFVWTSKHTGPVLVASEK